MLNDHRAFEKKAQRIDLRFLYAIFENMIWAGLNLYTIVGILNIVKIQTFPQAEKLNNLEDIRNRPQKIGKRKRTFQNLQIFYPKTDFSFFGGWGL